MVSSAVFPFAADLNVGSGMRSHHKGLFRLARAASVISE